MTSSRDNLGKLTGERNTGVRGGDGAVAPEVEQLTDDTQALVGPYLGACGMGLAPETGEADDSANWAPHGGLLTLPHGNGGDGEYPSHVVRGN